MSGDDTVPSAPKESSASADGTMDEGRRYWKAAIAHLAPEKREAAWEFYLDRLESSAAADTLGGVMLLLEAHLAFFDDLPARLGLAAQQIEAAVQTAGQAVAQQHVFQGPTEFLQHGGGQPEAVCLDDEGQGDANVAERDQRVDGKTRLLILAEERRQVLEAGRQRVRKRFDESDGDALGQCPVNDAQRVVVQQRTEVDAHRVEQDVVLVDHVLYSGDRTVDCHEAIFDLLDEGVFFVPAVQV